VGGVAGVDSVGAVDQSGGMLAEWRQVPGEWMSVLEVVELPVVTLLDVEDSSLFVWEGHV
jgi:hypothetical protein